ncbi:MAG: radical SAM protein [Candidatus Omnitrophica bacterium]|nr:radical SAM protein [Candidatus Omnitrophota bacterium]MDD5592949.1 radical SAM protein [Candidatus Omnitrophota bacterium]
MKYIYGPVKSRRLGMSLGITLTPHKICSFNCIYCQLGQTSEKTREIKEYIPPQEIVDELKSWLENNVLDAKRLDYITLSGSGEPTLNIAIGQLIAGIKNITLVPITVITNASLLNIASVRKALLGASLIVPSLNAINERVFTEINRPQEAIETENIISGLIDLRKEFRGKIWLEVMLVKGVNDDLRHIKKLKDAIEKINPDKIQLNSPIRTTAKENVSSLEKGKLEKIRRILGDKCEII